MNHSALLATAALLLLPGLLAWAEEPSFQPQHAVLVLRNRQVLEGEVTPAGDYYLVSLGKTGQIRLPAKDVEMVCRDLAEAYERKRERIGKSSAPNADSHFDLADWCLRQSLNDFARIEIETACKIEPLHARRRELEKRLEFATTKPESKPAAKIASSVATVGAPQLERTMKELPPGTVEHFTAVIQPILADRCGAGGCHGVGTKAHFQLLEPVAGKVPSRRFTQRNLFSTLSISDKEQPHESELLRMALKPHGHLEVAAFKSDKDRQYREITKWLESLRAVPKQSPPATVNAAALGGTSRQMASPGDSRPEEPTAPMPPLPVRDPFDPEAFNRRYHRPAK